MSMDPASISLPGAVSLGPSTPAPARANVLDVTEATFATEVLDRSRTTPVVLDFWAAWCGPCKQLSPVLEKLAGEGGGSWLLAKVDCDANPQLAQAAGIQGIPAVKAVVGEQVVGEFTGVLPEAQVRQWIESLLEAVRTGSGAPEPPPDQGPAEVTEAEVALRRDDLDAATSAYQRLAEREPGSVLARAGLAQIGLVRRVRGSDERAVRTAATQRPDDVVAVAAVSDLDMAGGQVEAAFNRLLELVRRLDGPERDQARARLLALFDLLSPQDPRLAAARRQLTTALF